jgi:uncharacterized protein YqhQ
MMRGPRRWAVAVRTPDGRIASESHPLPWDPKDHPWVRLPLVRGVFVLVESLVVGMKALRISAAYSLAGGEVEISEKGIGLAMGVALVVFAAVFIAAPALAGKLGGHAFGVTSSVGQNLVEGAIRIGLFLAYVAGISFLPGIRRVYQYHGAEHKTIAAYENGDPLEPGEVDRYSTLHVRCGTNFLFIVLALTIVVGLALDVTLPHVLLVSVTARVLAIPVLAALGYEVIRAAGRDEQSLVFRIASLPGLAVQKITTRPPDAAQIEVAIAALQAVVAAEAMA